MQAILSHVFNRLQRLETDMSVLQGKEKDLRTVVADGFAKADHFAVWTRNQFVRLEDQIDALAIVTNDRFDGLERRMDKMDGRMDKLDGRMGQFDGRMDRLERHATDTNVKLDKILNYLAIA